MKKLVTIQDHEIVVRGDDFAQGYVEGYNYFIAQQNTPISDELIAHFIQQAMRCPLVPTANAGYITGWIAALLKQQTTQVRQKRCTQPGRSGRLRRETIQQPSNAEASASSPQSLLSRENGEHLEMTPYTQGAELFAIG